MKKKNFYSLWAAALLMIVGGCSEELGEGDDPNGGGNGKGGEAYVSVTISSPSTKAMTKADGSNNPNGGEEGDDHEEGTPNEREIHDVTVILYDLTNNTNIDNENSTHAMVVNGTESGKTSFIEIASGNSKENPAEATAFVERLAAKITVAKKEEQFTVDVLNDKVTLTRFTIVNQLKAGSYLLKRVTQNVVDSDIDIPNKDGDIYIGDETPTPNGKATNFVIDPWTRHKDGSFSEITRATDFYSTTGGLIKYEELYANSFTKQGYEKKEGADYDIKQYTKYYADFFKGENSDKLKLLLQPQTPLPPSTPWKIPPASAGK